MEIAYFVVGLLFLIIGAEALVRGASRSAAVLGISPLVIGLTVVAFGTSSPELAVSIKAALSGQANIALGNVVGSNIFNVLFILGVASLIVPLVVSRQLMRIDVPLMILVSVIVLFFSLDGMISFVDGVIFFVGLIIYVWFLIYQSRKESAKVNAEYSKEFGVDGFSKLDWAKNIGLVIGGLLLLVIGSRWLVESAVSFAQYMGVSELVVGLTIVAAGTSLPEVVTSIIAAVRGERDIAVGNVVGSNIFNIMGVLGISSIVAPSGIEVSTALVGFDIPVMIVVALACFPIFFTGGIISRKEGVLFLLYYVAYTMYLVLAASQHDALPMFSSVMFYFAIPLTLVTIFVVALQEMRKRKQVS
ncbi:MAG TPA: sodium:calcium antiporter [Bacteroidetes bacterium]|nr:sodium:calcium antiporter [Bacteroidota bacterium]